MQIAQSLDFTFRNHLQNIYYARDVIEEQQISNFLAKFERLSTNMHYLMPLLYLIDYTKSEYVIMTNACKDITGYHPQEFLEAGIPLLIDIFQKDDFKVYNEEVFKRNASFLAGQPRENHEQYIFSYNFRVLKNKEKKTYVNLSQRGSYITSAETGLPLISLGLVTNITPFKTDRTIYHSIEKTYEENGQTLNQMIDENYFFPYGEDKILSTREKEILDCMANGLSSKQIAYRLKIAENTVANHRKSMLQKTNTKNVAELIAFACRSSLF